MTSTYDAYSCILHAEGSLKPYVRASCNYSNIYFYGTLPCSMGRASPAHPRHGCWGVEDDAESPFSHRHWDRGAAFGILDCCCWASKGRVHGCCRPGKKKIWLIFLLFFPRGLATLLNPGAIRERKILLNLAIAVLIIFFAPSKPAQPLMSHNWLLSAPNLFTEVRINF